LLLSSYLLSRRQRQLLAHSRWVGPQTPHTVSTGGRNLNLALRVGRICNFSVD
jgi:hypothetical protein